MSLPNSYLPHKLQVASEPPLSLPLLYRPLTVAEVDVAVLPAGGRGRLNGEQHLLADQLLAQKLATGPGARLVGGGVRVAGAAPRRPRGRHIAEIQLTLLGPASARLTPDSDRISR